MVAFSPSDLPPSVDTVEKLVVWSTTLLNHVAPTVITMSDGRNEELAAQAAPYQFNPPSGSTFTTPWYELGRFALPLDPEWREQGFEYKAVLEVSSEGIPPEFTT